MGRVGLPVDMSCFPLREIEKKKGPVQVPFSFRFV